MVKQPIVPLRMRRYRLKDKMIGSDVLLTETKTKT